MSVKITELQAENFKRVKAVQITPASSGLTIVGGNNGQGKTSVLDAIAWALGGDRFRPSAPGREGSVIPPNIHLSLSNGIKVQRNGKNSSLKVYDPSGNRAGQQLLNGFIEAFALDLPKFMEQSSQGKARTLLKIIGIGEQLAELDREETEAYNERLAIGRIYEQKSGHAKDLPYWDGVPEAPVSAAELIRQQQDILARNGENARLRTRRDEIGKELAEVSAQLETLRAQYTKLSQDYANAQREAVDLHDESTEELEANIRAVDALNVKIRQNMDRARAEAEAKEYSYRYDALTGNIEDIRRRRMDLLNGADMPLPGLSVESGELTYKGQRWDNMSGAEQLQVATAIVRRLNPQCGFVLLDKLEQMDLNTLRDFGAWLEQEGLQAIATRVSTGDECSIIIEDGYVQDAVAAPAKTWKEGEF